MLARALRAVFAFSAPWLAAAALAAETGSVTVRESDVRRSDVDETAAAAAEWGVRRDDVARYRELMAGRRGVWSPDADPLVVLGAHARTVEERRRLAEAFVVAEHARVEGELAFEREVQAAWRRLFPGQQRVSIGGVSAAVAVHFSVLVARDCGSCGSLVGRYVRRGVPVDFYVEGALGDADLRRWVAEQGIESSAIGGGRLTVNHSNGSVPGEAPAVWGRGADGRWFQVE